MNFTISMWCTLQRSVKPGICFSVCVQTSLSWLIFEGLVGSVRVESLSAPLYAHSIAGSDWGQVWEPHRIFTDIFFVENCFYWSQTSEQYSQNTHSAGGRLSFILVRMVNYLTNQLASSYYFLVVFKSPWYCFIWFISAFQSYSSFFSSWEAVLLRNTSQYGKMWFATSISCWL